MPQKRRNWRAVGQSGIQQLQCIFDHVLVLQCHLFFFLLGFKRPSFFHLATSLNRDSFKFGGFFSKTPSLRWTQVAQRFHGGKRLLLPGRETYGEALWAKIQEERHGSSVQISGAQKTFFFVAFFFGGLNFQSLNATLFGSDQT